MYKPGDHLAICDLCGLRGYASRMKKTWQGLIVHPECYEPRHPQETIQVRKDRIVVPDPRPEGTDTFLSPGDVTPDSL